MLKEFKESSQHFLLRFLRNSKKRFILKKEVLSQN